MTGHILVTGGAGYIGSHACKALAQDGYTPVTYDNLIYGHKEAVKWGPFVHGDLADGVLLRSVLRDYDIGGVMHFAAYAYVGESIQNPGKYFRNNVSNTIGLLDAMFEIGVENMVFSSTCATYGNPVRIPIDESHPQQPVNPYGESKLFVEKALRWYELAHGIRSCSLRYFNAAGADPEGEIGEDHDPETHLIPLVIQTALGQREQVQIFGTDYQTRDGTAIRDYIHVSDLASAHVLAIENLINGGESQQINLGTGKGYTVQEVIQMVEKVAGLPVNTHESARREGDPPELIAQADLAAARLGWRPCYSDLKDIVSTAVNWHRSPAWRPDRS